jgi:hypothetical protein
MPGLPHARSAATPLALADTARAPGGVSDVYFSADIETDGPIPGEYSMLSFALVYAGRFDGTTIERPVDYAESFDAELRPMAERFQPEALAVNGLDRDHLLVHGRDPREAMGDAAAWVRAHLHGGTPILVAYPLSFDWTWLYWYFVHFLGSSPFNHSRCLDLKTAIAIRGRRPVAASGHDKLPAALRPTHPRTHRALDDAIEQAQILANLYAWDGA